MQERLVRRAGKRLVGVVIPPAGPPITLPLGWLLPGGQVQLDAGMEVEGIFWENLDRQVHSNGTIVYKEGGVVEHGQFLVGSLTDGGQVTLLPSLGGEQVDLTLLRSLNMRRQTAAGYHPDSPGQDSLSNSPGQGTREEVVEVVESGDDAVAEKQPIDASETRE